MSISKGAYRQKAEAKIEEGQAKLKEARAKAKGASADTRLEAEKHIAAFVVDVSGHGVASSLLAVTIGRLLTPHVSSSSVLASTWPVRPWTAWMRRAPQPRAARSLKSCVRFCGPTGFTHSAGWG